MADHKENKEKAFSELKKRMEGDMEDKMYNDDEIFYKFLIARDYDVDKAEHMLKQHLEWRKKYDVENISKYQPPEVLKNYFILTMLGHDKEGRVLKYNDFANTDYRGICESCKLDDWFKCLIQYFEEDIAELKRQSEKLGRLVDKVMYIVNMENFSLTKATDKKVIMFVAATINMYLNNYPESLHAVYVINAPVYFNIFFSLMKPFLPSTVIKKIKIYSDDSGTKALQEAIDDEVLPMFLGGKRTDPDGNPLCLTLIKKPGTVPKSCYLSENKRLFICLPEVKRIIVPKAAFREIDLEVNAPDSYLEWEVQLKSGDIKFGIFYENNKEEKFEIIPFHKLNTDEGSEQGLYKCENTGKYTVVFDNTHSILRSKEIYYKLKATNLCELPFSKQDS